MRICAAQIRSFRGEIERNIDNHLRFIELAAFNNADLIFFPELSVTGYDRMLANELAGEADDERFEVFQTISDRNTISIAVGMPTRSGKGTRISMIIFEPEKKRQTYSKQLLWHEELPFFTAGTEQIFLETGGKKIAPAICYESLQRQHYEYASQNHSDLYIASVAKDADSIARAYMESPKIAREYSMTVLMSNCVGSYDSFAAAGQSAVWRKDGQLAGRLGDTDEGILLFDTETEKTFLF